jgi:phosphate transport system substrate-binding protein
MKRFFFAAAMLLATALSAQNVQINGAGATFPNPIYSKWFSDYNKFHPNVMINYQPIGSGGGIRQLSAGTVPFGDLAEEDVGEDGGRDAALLSANV